MIKAEQVPDEVVEAALKKRGLMREAIADALKAWPGIERHSEWHSRTHGRMLIILPIFLTRGNSNDKG